MTFTLNIIKEKPIVGVVTPTMGKDCLQKAIDSVQFQSYPSENIKHYVVFDGVDGSKYNTNKKDNVLLHNLPENTGKEHYGHRIFAAFAHLVNCDVVMFLDDDNQYGHDHIETMVDTIYTNKYHWAYSLRSIWDQDGTYVCDDNCESLGRWPTYMNENDHLVDTSCFGFRTPFLEKLSPLWHQKYGGDRLFYNSLINDFKHDNFGCTGNHSLKYFLGSSETSVKKEFFLEGNKIMEKKYAGKWPWLA